MDQWWRSFDDPTLTQLVEEAAAEGPQIRLAALRLLEARASARQTVARYLPGVSAQASGQYTVVVDGPELVGSFQSFVTGGGALVQESEQATGVYGPRVQWEVPLFGRLQAAIAGNRALLALADADRRAVRVAVEADTASAYVQLRAAQASREALAQSVANAEELAAILEIGAQAGLTAPADAADARRLAETARARLPQAELAVQEAQTQLSVLRGRAPGTEPAALAAVLGQSAPLPQAPLFQAPAAPADLLRMRPDIADAEARVLAAAADLGAARSDLLPQLNLTGGLNIADNLIGSSLPERLAQAEFSPILSMPLFDWGERLAAVRARDARLEQALLVYRQTVIAGVGEASDALAALSLAADRTAASARAEAAAEAVAVGARAAYDAGLQSLADRLRAEQQLIDARTNRIDAQANQALAAIAVFRAFGGALLTSP